MTLFLSLLPLYLLGNFHCIGMCGPLVALLGRHPYRYWYFLGRVASFALAGYLAGEVGAVLNVVLAAYQIPAFSSLLFGSLLLLLGAGQLSQRRFSFPLLQTLFARTSAGISLLLLREQAWPTFLFGFFTVALPCGQTLIVFSACALAGDPLTGFLNGAVFALLTTPALLLALQAHVFLRRFKRGASIALGLFACLAGLLALARAAADLGAISHCGLQMLHLVLF